MIRRSALAAALIFLATPALSLASECVPGRNLLLDLAPEARAEVERAENETPNGTGRLFRVERGEAPPSHLFGTMHLSDPRVVALPPAAESAFAASRRLVVETLEIADEAEIAAVVLGRPELTTLEAGTELLDLVPAESRAAVERELSAAGMPAASVRTLQPWFVAVALVTPDCEAERQAAGAEVLDLALLRRAQAVGMELAGLEKSAEQLEALASMPLAMQGENLAATLELLPRLPDIFETMIALYAEGRIAAITAAVENLAPAGTDADRASAVYAAFEARVVTERNHTMAERLGPLLEGGGAFVAVGALHLPGEDGLVELLRGRGYTVTRAD